MTVGTWLVMTFMLVAAAILQTILPPIFYLGQVKFPFLLAVALYYALNRETHMTLVASFFAGFFQDIMSPIPLGFSVFWFCVIGFVASRFRRLVLTETPMTPALFGAAGTVVASIGLFVLMARESLVFCPFWKLMWKLVGSCVVGALCTPLVFSVAGRMDRLAGNIEIQESMDEIE